jgi:hypothetical protein
MCKSDMYSAPRHIVLAVSHRATAGTAVKESGQTNEITTLYAHREFSKGSGNRESQQSENCIIQWKRKLLDSVCGNCNEKREFKLMHL